MSNVDNFSDGAEVDLDGNRFNDYTPAGNVIYVSPRYLIEEKVTISSEFMDKMQNLSEGEFGLILPESLREQSAYYQGLFTDYLQNFSSGKCRSDESETLPSTVNASFYRNRTGTLPL